MAKYLPVELEAIAKVAKYVAQLNEILKEDDKSTMQIDWNAYVDHGATIIASNDSEDLDLVVLG